MGTRSNGKGRTTAEGARLLARRTECLRRHLAGESFGDIGRSMSPKMSKQLVAVDCHLALKEYRERNRLAVSEMIEMELQTLDYAQLESRLAWELSKERNKGLGDAQYIEELAKMSDRRRKLLGLDKPTKIEAQATAEVNVSTGFKTIEQMQAETMRRQQAMKARKAEAK